MAQRKKIKTTEFDALAGQNIRFHFLDSGAFSMRFLAKRWAKKTGQEESEFYDSPEYFHYLDAYAVFIQKYGSATDIYANVDVMGDAERSFRNQLYLEGRGILPVPVVHFGDSIEDLDRYLDRGYDYIGFGGLAKWPADNDRQNWLDKMFDYICSTPDRLPRVKIHGFGVGGFYWMQRYPWYSVDSTTWLKNAAYGAMLVPKTHRSKTKPKQWEFKHNGWYYTFRYDVTPELVDVTLGTYQSLTGNHFQYYQKQNHLRAVRIQGWLDFIGFPFGETEYGDDPKDIVIKVAGVSNDADMRSAANIKYFLELLKRIPPWPRPFKLHTRQSFDLFS
jgi:hypothetical protein